MGKKRGEEDEIEYRQSHQIERSLYRASIRETGDGR
jgi:hypothetical protein